MMNQARRDFAAKLLSQPAVCLAEVYRKRGDVEYLIGAYSEANADLTSAKALFTLVRSDNKCGEIYHAMGNVCIDMGKFEEAENYYNTALDLFQKVHDKINIAKCYKELGKVKQYLEKTDEALLFYQKAMCIYKQIDEIKGCNIITEYLADIYRVRGEYEKSLYSIDELLFFYQNTNDLRSLSRIYKIAGNVFMEKGDFIQSQKHLENAYKYSINTGENSIAMYVLCDLGLVCYNFGKYTSACEYFTQCLFLAEKLSSSYMLVVNLINLADANFKMGNIERSKYFITRAATINHNIGGLTSEIQRIQEEIAQKEGDQEKAGKEKSRETQGDQVPHAT